jgi:hypothetical protein
VGGDAKRTGESEVALGFGWQYWGLVAAGVPAMIPVAGWSVALVPLLAPGADKGSPGGDSPLAMAAGIVGVFLLLAFPSVVACLTLRARQPRGARITWDEDAIVEWDGPWRRAVIPWSRARVAHLSWVVHLRLGTMTLHAIQIVDAQSDATITAWEDRPNGAPLVRRRLRGDVKPLVGALEPRGHVSSHAIDWSRIVEPDRPRRRWILVLGRLGYPLVVAGAIGAPDSTTPGYILGAIGAALLAIRALPVFHELRATLAHLGRDAVVDDGRAAALRLKLRAVAFEAFVRAMVVVLTVASTIAGGITLHR